MSRTIAAFPAAALLITCVLAGAGCPPVNVVSVAATVGKDASRGSPCR